jgi:hypothetical protein
MPATAVNRYLNPFSSAFPFPHSLLVLFSPIPFNPDSFVIKLNLITNDYAFYSLVSLGLVEENGQEKVIYQKDMWNEKVSFDRSVINEPRGFKVSERSNVFDRIIHIRGWGSSQEVEWGLADHYHPAAKELVK